MKKFFSLVLALVMALSLTTVAWGETCSDPATCTHKAAIGAEHYATLQAAVDAAAAGATVTLLDDVTEAYITVMKNITIDGDGHKITASGYGVDIKADVDVSLIDLTVEATSYAVNLRAASAGSTVTITGCALTGVIALNVWGENVTVTATDSDFTSVDNSAAENYSAIQLNNNGANSAENSVVTITGGTITAYDENGGLSAATLNGTLTGNINVSNSTVVTGENLVPVAVIRYPDGTAYVNTSLAGLLDNAVSGDTISLIRDAELTEEFALPAGVTLDGAGYTVSVSGTTWSTDNADKHLVELGTGSKIMNVTLDSEGLAYGVHAYCVTDAELSNVTIKNSKGAGLTVNGAEVEAVDLKTSGNAWGSVNVDPGSGVTSVSKFAVSGNNTNLADATAIYGDEPAASTDPAVEITISGGTYNGAISVPADAGTVAISGGMFSEEIPAAYMAPGLTLIPDAYGNYVLAATADVPTGSSSKPYFTTDFVNFKVSTYCDLDNYKYELRHYYNGSDAAKMFDKKVIVAIDEFGGLTYLYEVVVAASKDSATLAFVNGRDITYLNTVNPNWVGKATLVKTVEFDDAAKCGDVFTKNDVAVYEDANGVLYVENKSGAPYNVDNGKLVLLVPAADVVVPVDVFEAPGYTYTNNVVYTIGHDYDYNLKSVNGKQSVTSVFCKDKDCGKTFKFLAGTEAEAIAKFKAGNYVDSGLKINTTTVVWVAKDGVSAGGSANLPVTLPTAPSTDKVTSAETFDAGIAMYVGMSVMAAAGSAVVIGKKKD